MKKLEFVCTHIMLKGLFTHTDPVSVTVPIKVYHCANGDGHFDWQNGSGSHSASQTAQSPLAQ